MKLYELYLMVLLCNKYVDKEMPYDMDYIWNAISKYYYYNTNINTQDRDILFDFIKNSERYNLLDKLMNQVVDRFINKDGAIDKTDKFFISNVIEMKKIMEEHQEYLINKIKDKKDVSLSKISKWGTINHVKEILKIIDPSGEWLNIYEEVLDKGKIAYFNELDDDAKKRIKEDFFIDSCEEDINSCAFINNSEGYIILTYKGTIADVVATVHEISHYISRYKNNWQEEVPTLREFHSIFYELYALDYLKKAGFKEEEIEALNQERSRYLNRQLSEKMVLMDYLVMYIRYGRIKEEYDSSCDKYERCDKCVNYLVNNPYVLHDFYPYIIGNSLATLAMERIKNDKILFSIIKYITDNISKIDAYDVFNIVGLGDNRLVREDSNLLKTKKKVK